MITYRATLDVPEQTAFCVSRWLAAHRKVHDVRPWQRAATPFVQAVLVLRWFKDATDLRILARDARVSIATAYRYLHEAIDVIAQHAPDLHDVLAHGLREGWEFVCLDGTLIPSVRCCRSRLSILETSYETRLRHPIAAPSSKNSYRMSSSFAKPLTSGSDVPSSNAPLPACVRRR